jgi:hypothetical protein
MEASATDSWISRRPQWQADLFPTTDFFVPAQPQVAQLRTA